MITSSLKCRAQQFLSHFVRYFSAKYHMGVRWKNLLYLDIVCILDCTLCLKPLLCLLHLHVNSVRQILKKVLKSARGFISLS